MRMGVSGGIELQAGKYVMKRNTSKEDDSKVAGKY